MGRLSRGAISAHLACNRGGESRISIGGPINSIFARLYSAQAVQANQPEASGPNLQEQRWNIAEEYGWLA